jgi:hypothetical protein
VFGGGYKLKKFPRKFHRKRVAARPINVDRNTNQHITRTDEILDAR